MSLRLGPYVLHEKVAAGGMAEVFKATLRGEEGFERPIAIKRILPELTEDDDFVKMFIDEAKIAVQLSHPNIAHIYDLGIEGDTYYIALEYVHGRDMRAIHRQQVAAGGRLPVPIVIHVAMKVCDALHHAHTAQGRGGVPLRIIHRDVSPQNILVSYEGEVKVIDFGLAKATGRMTQTQVGVVKGKLAYMSPEHARGEPIDHRTDIFALGSCMFEWLTGEILFQRATDVDTILAVQQAQVPSLRTVEPSIHPELDAIIMHALKGERGERFQTAQQLQEALEEFAYSHGQAVTGSQVAIYMRKLFPELASVPQMPTAVMRRQEPHDTEPPEEDLRHDTIPAPAIEEDTAIMAYDETVIGDLAEEPTREVTLADFVDETDT